VLGPILDRNELKLVSGWYSLELLTRSVEEEIEAVDEHLTLLKELGATVMVVCEVTNCIHCVQETPVHLRPKFPENRWKEYGQKLTDFAKYTKSKGVKISYHHHMGTVIETAEDVDNLMTHTGPDVGLLLDTGHLMFAGENPADVAKRWAKRINHVHCKDIRKEILADVKNRQLSFLDSVLTGVYTVPGDGCINYPEIFNILKKADYHGWLVVEAEQDPERAHPLTYATMGYNNLRNFAKEAELIN